MVHIKQHSKGVKTIEKGVVKDITPAATEREGLYEFEAYYWEVCSEGGIGSQSSTRRQATAAATLKEDFPKIPKSLQPIYKDKADQLAKVAKDGTKKCE